MKKIFIFLFALNLSLIPLYAKNNKVEAVRGVWLTTVDSKVLNSKKSIIKAVNFCSELGINTIFVAVWDQAMTTYPSKIMKKLTGVEIDTEYTGRDPLREVIDAAHKKNIKVFAWFEYGFSSSYKQHGGILLKVKPNWAAINKNGNLVTKNGFDWMNGFNPKVQNFILSLIMEVVKNYKVDGIQGDDRLPAMPSESGYDKYTVNLYETQHNGKKPPENYKDSAWVQWRANILNKFLGKLYKTVKSYNKNLIVSMAPSLYPWSKEEYLQDWPEWLKKGYVDLIIPQVYRYSISKYDNAIEKIVYHQIPKNKLFRFYPGILLKVGNYYPSRKFLKEMINENRKLGIPGEVYFFYEGLKQYPGVFRKIYQEKAEFPSSIN